ncbi:helix-turn-helix domain-containing protein, partial [Aestuariibius sp. 2305UL40-4]|uniref:helix-turn-helix domain-containing protein n=1 Tax=Aestuariibius violaceus TaxID=3234132 RepID=UPI00398F1218
EFVRSNIGEGVSVGDLARLCDMPVGTFNRHFKKRMRLSPYQFVQKLRVQMACEFLLADRSALPEIAFRLGYADQNHMSRSFRKYLGTSPSQFRHDRKY